jgi:hypothetical protein
LTVWEKEQFDLQSKYRLKIKSVKPIPDKRDRYYYRYTVEIEVYKNETDADQRMRRLREAPPGVDEKMEPEYLLHDGFKRGKLVYIVSMNVYTFVVDKCLTRLGEQ